MPMISIVHQIYSRYDLLSIGRIISSSPNQVTPEISTIASSSAGVLVADIHGSVHILNSQFESAISWVAHVGGRVTHMVERKGVLVTLGVCSAFLLKLLH